MIRRVASLIFVLIWLSLGACEKNRENDKPVLILDAWWTEDYAKNACRTCGLDPILEVRNFEMELNTEIAADEKSHGFNFLVFYGSANTSEKALPSMAKAMARPHWMLGVDFIPGQAKQSWWLAPPVGQTF